MDEQAKKKLPLHKYIATGGDPENYEGAVDNVVAK